MRKMKLEDTPHTCEEVKHLPVTWCKLMKVKILDPDGWREDNKSWEAPLTRVDFLARAAKSTTNRLYYGEKGPAITKTIPVSPYDYDKVRHVPETWLQLMGKDSGIFKLWQKEPDWTHFLTRVEFLEQLQFELFRERDNQQLETPKSKVKVDVIGKRIKDTEAILYEGHMIGGNFHTDCAFRVVLTNQVAILEAILAANSKGIETWKTPKLESTVMDTCCYKERASWPFRYNFALSQRNHVGIVARFSWKR